MYKHKLIFCTQKVNKSGIRRENRRGVEHVILTSFTLPPDIVMNGGLYPSEEVKKSFLSLNRTPVTIEHPELDGVFVSANDPEIDFDFRMGAFNENAQMLDDGRISIDKVINVQKAMKSEKGKRLLDRISELENSESPRSMHTSVGVFVDAEDMDEPVTNADGQEYTWVARNMVFDHDAILLDSIGAATPDQGTGIGINKESIKVEHFIVSESVQPEKIQEKEVNPSSSEYHTNQPNKGDAMRDSIIAKLKELGISVNADISNSDLLAKYNEANKEEAPKVEPTVNKDLIDTVKDQSDKIEALEKEIKSNSDKEIADKIKTIQANSKYSTLSDDALKAISNNSSKDFDKIYDESIPSHGVGPTMDFTKEDDFSVNTKIDDLPD